MALTLSATLTDRLASADDSTWAAGTTGSVFLWFKPAWSSGDGVDHVLFNCGVQTGAAPSASWKFFRMEKWTDNNIYMGFYDTSTDYRVIAADTGLFTGGTWATHLVTWDSSTPLTTYYVNNSSVGTSGTLVVPNWQAQSGDREDIGNDLVIGGYGAPADGAIAELARWNRVLDATERAILQAGFSPLFLLRGLVEYRPLINGSASRLTLAEGPDVTVNASGTSFTTHPRMLYPATTLGRWLHTAAVSTGGPGFRSFQSLWFGPDAGGSAGAPVSPAGGFRSFQSLWFGPDAGGSTGAVVVVTASGRKLISPAFAKTLTAELT